MTIFCSMLVISIISGFSCQIPATEKSLKLVYVLSVLSNYTFPFQNLYKRSSATMRVDGIFTSNYIAC